VQADVTTTTPTNHHGTATTTTPSTMAALISTVSLPECHRFSGHHSQASVTALFSDSSTKLIPEPTDSRIGRPKRSLKIGDRVPVATGSFQPGIGGVGINPWSIPNSIISTVGVNIDITPHVHAGGKSR